MCLCLEVGARTHFLVLPITDFWSCHATFFGLVNSIAPKKKKNSKNSNLGITYN
jgi:hypothetical protein